MIGGYSCSIGSVVEAGTVPAAFSCAWMDALLFTCADVRALFKSAAGMATRLAMTAITPMQMASHFLNARIDNAASRVALSDEYRP